MIDEDTKGLLVGLFGGVLAVAISLGVFAILIAIADCICKGAKP
jgi:hypothetical protein